MAERTYPTRGARRQCRVCHDWRPPYAYDGDAATCMSCARSALPAPEVTRRVCLRCDEPFLSKNNYRRCARCRSKRTAA